MSRMIFVNLPVRDVAKATAFYEAVGARKNPRFSDESTTCAVFSETIHAMLLSHERFMQFSPKPIADRGTCEVLFCLSAESREAVDAMVEKAGLAGGGVDPSAPHDHGFMYGRSFEDLDGHLWQVMWMDPAMAEGDTPIGQECA